MDADVPAVVGIDLLTVAKLVIDVKNRCVYSHHHAYLEVEPATSECEPVIRVENASSFTHPPPTTSTSSSAQTDLTCVSTELCDTSPTGVGAPSPPPLTDATRRPTLPHPPAPLPSPPLVMSPPYDTVKFCLDPQAPLYQPSGISSPHSSDTPPFIPPPPSHYRPSTSEPTARSLHATDTPPDVASDFSHACTHPPCQFQSINQSIRDLYNGAIIRRFQFLHHLLSLRLLSLHLEWTQRKHSSSH